MDSEGIRAASQFIPELPVRKHRRDLRQNQEVLFRRLPRHEQNEHIGHGFAVGRVEWHRHLRPNEGRDRTREPLHTRMGYGYSAAQSGRAELFALSEGRTYGCIG